MIHDDAHACLATQGAVAGLTFVLSNAAKYDVDDQALLQEIQQLGRWYSLVTWPVHTLTPLAASFACRPAKGEQRGGGAALPGAQGGPAGRAGTLLLPGQLFSSSWAGRTPPPTGRRAQGWF